MLNVKYDGSKDDSYRHILYVKYDSSKIIVLLCKK